MLIPRPPLLVAMALPLGLGVMALWDKSYVGLMLAADVGLVLLCVTDALLGWSQRFEVRREAPDVLSLGRANRVGLSVRNLGRRRTRCWINDDVFDDAHTTGLPARVELEPQASATLDYAIEPNRRGAYELGAHYVRYPCPLGLLTRQVRLKDRTSVRVYPDLLSIRAYDLLARQDRQHALMRTSRLKGGESEFERLRDYTRDDEYRSVDWRATARHQRLIAREYQLESNQNLFFMLEAGRLMTQRERDTTLFDHALNAALMLGHIAARGGDRVGLMGFDDEVRAFVAPQGGGHANRRLIQASYDLHPRVVEPDFDAAFDQMQLRVRQRSLVVLFTQVIDDATARKLVEQARQLARRHLPLLVLFKDPELEALMEPESGESRSALYTRAAAAELLRWREGFIVDLRRAGVHVLDVGPRKLTAKLINQYLQIKARHLL